MLDASLLLTLGAPPPFEIWTFGIVYFQSEMLDFIRFNMPTLMSLELFFHLHTGNVFVFTLTPFYLIQIVN